MIGYDKNFQNCNGLSYNLSYMAAIFALINDGKIKYCDIRPIEQHVLSSNLQMHEE